MTPLSAVMTPFSAVTTPFSAAMTLFTAVNNRLRQLNHRFRLSQLPFSRDYSVFGREEPPLSVVMTPVFGRQFCHHFNQFLHQLSPVFDINFASFLHQYWEVFTFIFLKFTSRSRFWHVWHALCWLWHCFYLCVLSFISIFSTVYFTTVIALWYGFKSYIYINLK